jgi:metal-responsive CopG/Arc/MetJ family transcriptional regulator
MTSEEERRRQHRHRHKQRVLRGIPDELVNDFDAAARAAGSDRSRITKALWEWYVQRPGAELPDRPEPPA